MTKHLAKRVLTFCILKQIFMHGKDDDEVISKNRQNVGTVSKKNKIEKKMEQKLRDNNQKSTV